MKNISFARYGPTDGHSQFSSRKYATEKDKRPKKLEGLKRFVGVKSKRKSKESSYFARYGPTDGHGQFLSRKHATEKDKRLVS